MTHTPEPWTWQDYRPHDDHAFIYPATGKGTVGTAMTNADAARIAACVNACAGIPTEQLAAAPVGALAKVVEALEFYEDGCDVLGTDMPCPYNGQMCCKTARAALAALRGGSALAAAGSAQMEEME